MLKYDIIMEIMKLEGGYTNNPNDSGGETNYGITEKVARDNGYNAPIQDMPWEFAFKVYEDRYWNSVQGDGLSGYSNVICKEVVDTAVNMGPGRAARFLQRSLNVLNGNQSLYKDIAVDGGIGAATLSALGECLAKREETVLAKALNCLQGAFYIELAEKRAKDKTFIYGWLKNRVVL